MYQAVTGSRVAIDVEFRVAGVLTDPTVVTASVRSPNAVLITETYPSTNLTRTGIGLFRFEFPVDVEGQWWARFESSGAVEAASEIPVQVDPSRVL